MAHVGKHPMLRRQARPKHPADCLTNVELAETLPVYQAVDPALAEVFRDGHTALRRGARLQWAERRPTIDDAPERQPGARATRAIPDGNAEGRAVIAEKVATTVAAKGAWRDLLPIHSAANKVPVATVAERRGLAGDLKSNGLKVPVILVRVAGGKPELLDGRR